MKKLLVSFIDLVFIIVFNIVFFAIGGVNHILATWIAYSFIHISYIILLLTSLIIKDKENAVIFNIPIISVTSIYFVPN